MPDIHSPDLNTPIGAISNFDLSEYDEVISALRKKQADIEAIKTQILGSISTLENTSAVLLSRLPELEARGVSRDLWRLASAERALLDGVVPPEAKLLEEEFGRNVKIATDFQKAVNKAINTICRSLAKLDADASARVRRVLSTLAHYGKRLATQYSLLWTRAQEISAASKLPLDGPVRRAYDLYKIALSNIEGVRGVGAVYPDAQDALPIYELPVMVDPNILADRTRLRAIEREADDFVEQRNPIAVGAIIFRFEPVSGAA